MSEVNEHAERLRDAAKSFAFLKMPGRASDCDSAAAEIERLAALERPWMPIESAPRDGTRVELWIEQERGGFASYGRSLMSSYGNCWRLDNGYPVAPTHWRPEPEGPK